MKPLRLLRFLPLFLLCPGTLRAQDPAPVPEAEAVARAAFEALDAMRFEDAAALVHPGFLELFRATQLEHARQMAEYWTSERRPPPDPAMPPEVAAWFEEQRTRHLEAWSGHPLEMTYAGVRSLEELEAMDAREMLVRRFRASDPRYQLLRQVEARGGELPEGECPERLLPIRRTVIGAVAEDDSTVQVVYRLHLHDLERLSVATLRAAPEGWRLWDVASDPGIPGGFSVGAVLGPEEMWARLEEAQGRAFEWSDGAGSSLRAEIVGYPGGRTPPRGLVVELRHSRGRAQRVEIPFDALPRLLEYLSPWMIFAPVSAAY